MYSSRSKDSIEEPTDDVGLLHDDKSKEEMPKPGKLKRQPWNRTSVWVAYLLGLTSGLLLFASVSLASKHAARGFRRVDRFPVERKEVFFKQDFKFVNEDVFTSVEHAEQALHEWVSLSSVDRGVVKIPPEQREGLPSPVVFSRDLRGPQPVYFMSAFHQLHCLSSILQSYAALRRNGDNYTAHERHGNGPGHLAHCFDYLRQSIMCAGDTTLEGRTYDGDQKVSIGWGAYHECRDWSQLKAWADDRQPWSHPYYPDFL